MGYDKLDDSSQRTAMSTVSDSRVLDTKSADYIATALRSIAGLVPIVGPLFSELASVVVPNQRMERIAKFCGGA